MGSAPCVGRGQGGGRVTNVRFSNTTRTPSLGPSGDSCVLIRIWLIRRGRPSWRTRAPGFANRAFAGIPGIRARRCSGVEESLRPAQSTGGTGDAASASAFARCVIILGGADWQSQAGRRCSRCGGTKKNDGRGFPRGHLKCLKYQAWPPGARHAQSGALSLIINACLGLPLPRREAKAPMWVQNRTEQREGQRDRERKG